MQISDLANIEIDENCNLWLLLLKHYSDTIPHTVSEEDIKRGYNLEMAKKADEVLERIKETI